MEVPVSMNSREARLGWVFLALEIFVLPRLFPMVNALLPKPLNSAQLNFAFFATNFLVVLLIFHDFLLENLRQFRKNIWKNLVVIALGFSLYTFVSALMGLLIDHFVPEFVNANDANVAAVAQNAPLLMGLGTAVLVPPTEETLFRGLLFGEPARKNKLTGWVVSTGIFALVHVTGYIGVYTPQMMALAIVQYLPAGIILAGCYCLGGSLAASVGVHALVNLCSYLIMFR